MAGPIKGLSANPIFENLQGLYVRGWNKSDSTRSAGCASWSNGQLNFSLATSRRYNLTSLVFVQVQTSPDLMLVQAVSKQSGGRHAMGID